MSNYNFIVAKINSVNAIPKSDFIQCADVLGESVIVPVHFSVGDIGVFFPVGSALSHDMCHYNNLYRNSSMNSDNNKSGFLEPNGRILALKLRGAISSGLFLPLDCLNWATSRKLKLGESFSEIDGKKVCSRYNPPKPQGSSGAGKTSKRGKVTKEFEAPMFDKHIDTSQFKYCVGQVKKGSTLYFHTKRHGTSARVSKTKVTLNLPEWKNVVNNILNNTFLLKLFDESDYRVVIGSRNTIITANEGGFYGSNEFRFKAAKELEPFLSSGMTIYSEIVGYTGGNSKIMPSHDIEKTGDKKLINKYGKSVDYLYGCNEGEFKNHIYRITLTTDGGIVMDMPQKVMEAWCDQRGLLCTTEVHPPLVYDGDEESLRKLVHNLTEREELLTEDFEYPNQLSEGIIIREECDTMIPKFYKSKSFWFRLLEGHNVEADLEEQS